MKIKYLIIKFILLTFLMMFCSLMYSVDISSNKMIQDMTVTNENSTNNKINLPRSREMEATERKLLEGYILNNYHISSSNNMVKMKELSADKDRNFRENLFQKYKKSGGLWTGTLNLLVPPMGMLGLGSLIQGDYTGVVIECVFTFGSIATSSFLFLGGNTSPSAIVLFIGLSLGYVSSWFIPIFYETGYNGNLKKGLNLMEEAPPAKKSISYYNNNLDIHVDEIIHIPLFTVQF